MLIKSTKETGKKLAIYDILKFVREHEEISDYNQLMDYAMDLKDDGDSAWFDICCRIAGSLKGEYISSRRNAVRDAEKRG